MSTLKSYKFMGLKEEFNIQLNRCNVNEATSNMSSIIPIVLGRNSELTAFNTPLTHVPQPRVNTLLFTYEQDRKNMIKRNPYIRTAQKVTSTITFKTAFENINFNFFN